MATIKYYSRIPAAALRREIDGQLYAYIAERLSVSPKGARIVQDYTRPRMVRADGAKIASGEAYVLFATIGDAVPLLGHIPFGVSVEEIQP